MPQVTAHLLDSVRAQTPAVEVCCQHRFHILGVVCEEKLLARKVDAKSMRIRVMQYRGTDREEGVGSVTSVEGDGGVEAKEARGALGAWKTAFLGGEGTETRAGCEGVVNALSDVGCDKANGYVGWGQHGHGC